MLRNLQIWHLVWIGLTPLLYALLRLTSEPYDADRVLVDNIVVVACAVWAGCLTVYFAVTGKRQEALPTLLRSYRNLLGSRWFLWISNLAGSVLVVFFAYHLCFFRQVEFISATDVELFLNDKTGNTDLIGIVRGRTPTSYRLPIGTRYVVVREIGSDKFLSSTPLEVPPLVRQLTKVRCTIPAGSGSSYEKLR